MTNKVRMISPNGDVSIISAAEANAMLGNVFMRPGHVTVSDIENGVAISDDRGLTTLTLIDSGDRATAPAPGITDQALNTDESESESQPQNSPLPQEEKRAGDDQ